jgi:RNA polymerase sigma-70 factor, ECF subfamily
MAAAHKGRSDPLQPSMRDAILSQVPGLRAFAFSLCRDMDLTDDLVQETLLRAIANIHSFQPGTNLAAWLVTILRNHFRSEYRKRRNEVEDPDGSHIASLRSAPDQDSRLEFDEFRAALAKLPIEQREALLLVGASGFSYEEAAAICGTVKGTIKSRVNRARTRLMELLALGGTHELGTDYFTRAVLTANENSGVAG